MLDPGKTRKGVVDWECHNTVQHRDVGTVIVGETIGSA